MSISGDMVASIVSHGTLDHATARLFLMKALETARDPNFASRYADEFLAEYVTVSDLTRSVGGDNKELHNNAMLSYWGVISS